MVKVSITIIALRDNYRHSSLEDQAAIKAELRLARQTQSGKKRCKSC